MAPHNIRGYESANVLRALQRLSYGCLRRLVELHCCSTATVVMCLTIPAMNTRASVRRSRRHDETGEREGGYSECKLDAIHTTKNYYLRNQNKHIKYTLIEKANSNTSTVTLDLLDITY